MNNMTTMFLTILLTFISGCGFGIAIGINLQTKD